jgi:hypothetical protein
LAARDRKIPAQLTAADWLAVVGLARAGAEARRRACVAAAGREVIGSGDAADLTDAVIAVRRLADQLPMCDEKQWLYFV